MRCALIILCLSGIHFGVDGKVFLGNTRLSCEKTDEITIMGVAHLNNIVARIVSITGSFTAQKITTNELYVTGPVKIDTGLVKKTVMTGSVVLNHFTVDEIKVTGPLIADNLIVIDSLDLTGVLNIQNSRLIKVTVSMDESSVKDSNVTDIFIKRPTSNSEVQRLKVYGKTQINRVEFESRHGEIHVYGKGVKLGKVTGAKVIEH
jgi:hypothetical protein